ncbi:LIM domain-containing protein [Phthorimaea operculella]|nr:LIM domain-containing protein [Phthorimaea operculella]
MRAFSIKERQYRRMKGASCVRVAFGLLYEEEEHNLKPLDEIIRARDDAGDTSGEGMFGSGGACAACGQAIPASEFVMRTSAPQQPLHVFHIKCFACSKCGSHLMQGDRYYMLAGALVCEQDWQKLMKSAGGAPGAPVRKGKVGRPRRSRE